MVNPEYEYKMVNTRDISVDMLYQRDLNQSRVKCITNKWNPYLVNAVKLSSRDGKLWVFDGQHTIAAIKSKHGGKDCEVDAKVFYGLTRLDESLLFIAQNGESAQVNVREKYRALFNNGDLTITAMVRNCEMFGFVVDFVNSQMPNRIVALRALYVAFETLGQDSFRDMLAVLRGAWNGSTESLCAEILGGLTYFINTYRGEYNVKRLTQRLAATSPTAIVRDGKLLSGSSKKRYAQIILGIYNKKTSSGRLEDRSWRG